jgi:hypothetical protein
MKDSTDPHALERACWVARREPFPGTSSAQCLAAIDEVMNSIGDTCPECDYPVSWTPKSQFRSIYCGGQFGGSR